MITFLLYRNYRFSFAVKFWVRRKFTPAGVVLLVGLLMTGGIGVDTSQAIAYQAFAPLAALMLISLGWSLFRAPRLIAERSLPRTGTAGQPLYYRLTVTNPGSKAEAAVTVMEDLGDPRPTYREFAETPEPGEDRRNPFDRFFRFYRWLWLVSRKELARSVPARLPKLMPGRPVEVEMKLIPLRRGSLRLPGLTFAVADPFGICRSYSKFSAPESILILPRRYALPDISLGKAAQYQPGGISLASSLGESEEFMSVREYRRGDPPRRIHWKSTSKTGKLIVKEFQNEFFVRQALILDTFLDDSSSPVFEEAVSIAASFALTLNTQESLLDLIFVGEEAFCVTAGHGVAQIEHMLRFLASVQPCAGRKFGDLEEIVFRQIGLVSGCVCILLKWDEERRSLVEQLGGLGIPRLVLVLKRAEEKPPRIELSNDRFARVEVIEAGKVQEGLSKL